MAKTIAAYGGGFKPPTSGHFEVVKTALKQNPEIDEFIIYVGGGERDGITQAEAVLIWEIYQTYLPMKVKIEPSKAPIGDVVRLGKNNPQDTVYFVIGGREGREDDTKDIESRTKGIEDKYPNMKIKIIQTPDQGMSGTNARKSAKVSPEEFYKYLPSELTDEEKEEVYNIVKPMVNEALIPSASEIKSKFKDLVAKVKQQGGDAKKALIMLVKAAKGEIDLTNDDKAFIKLQLKDALKAVLGTAIFALPAGSLVLILLKAIKLHGLVVPTAFLNERLEPYKFKTLFVENENNTTRYTFTTNQGTEYLVDLVNYPKTEVMVEYGAIKDGKKSWINPTNDGEPLKIISTVTEIIKEYYVSNPSLEVVKWEATKGKNNTKADSQRDKLNIKFFQREMPGIKVVHEGQETRIILPKLNENATYSKDIDIIEKCAALTNHMREKGYKIDPLPSIEFVNGDTENARDFFGKTAYYDPNEQKIVLYTEGRHPKDIVRSFAHEMIHHVQNLEDRLGNITTTDTTEDSNLEDIEKEAYLNGNISFRNWTDSLQENQMSQDDFNTIGDILRDSTKAKQIHTLLLQMFPQQKELLNYNYKNDSYAEFKRFIFHIDKYKLEGPISINHTDLKLDPQVMKDRERKYQEYIDGKTDKYFRDSDSDPRTLDLSKMPPITVDSTGEVMDGNHRAFLAIKQQKPLKGYKIVNANNTHPNVAKILQIVGRSVQEKKNKDPFGLNQYARELAQGLEEELDEGRKKKKDPKKGTGKKPEGSGRRLYTDEDPKDTVGVSFRTKEDIVDTLNKKSFKAKSHARQSQVINLIHQRVRAAYGRAKDPETKARLKRGLDYIEKRKEASKKKTQRLQAQKENVAPNHDGKAAPFGSGYEELNEGRYDAFVNKLSRIVFEMFKDIHDRGDKKGEFEFRVDHPDDEHDIPSEDFYFDLAGTVEITDDEYTVDGGANAGFDKDGNEITPLLSVKFKIPKNPDWQKVSFDIKDVVRHELEHLTQDGENVKGGTDSDDPKLVRPSKQMDDDQMIRDLIDLDLLPKADYFRLPKEIDAMLQGLYFKAKKSRTPFKDVINTYLDTQPINDEERENILKIWRSRAKALSLPLFEELEEMEYEIYSDMDGVITDFDASFMKASDGIRPSEYERNMGKDKFWELIDGKGVGFWVGMPWMSDGKQYWDYIKQYNPILLSSPSRSNTSRLGKRLWVRNNLPGTKLILAQAKDKQNYARKNRILIDDRPSNIEEWRSQGGIGILHTSASNTIRQLKELGL